MLKTIKGVVKIIPISSLVHKTNKPKPTELPKKTKNPKREGGSFKRKVQAEKEREREKKKRSLRKGKWQENLQR